MSIPWIRYFRIRTFRCILSGITGSDERPDLPPVADDRSGSPSTPDDARLRWRVPNASGGPLRRTAGCTAGAPRTADFFPMAGEWRQGRSADRTSIEEGWMQLGDVRALGTGAARGRGNRFAMGVGRGGGRVAAVDVDAAGLHTLAADAAGLPGQVEPMPGDVSDEAAVRAFVHQAAERMEGINVLVNNAAVLLDGVLVAEDDGWVRRLPAAQWRKVLDVNLTGQSLVAREVAAEMLARGEPEGVVVNLSSLARAGNAGQGAYAASKAGLD